MEDLTRTRKMKTLVAENRCMEAGPHAAQNKNEDQRQANNRRKT
jgi:hypothetical protein